jgi:hypothetical protein
MKTGNTQTNAKVTYYFNVDIPLRATDSLLGEGGHREERR